MTVQLQIIGASAEHERIASFADACRAFPGVEIRFQWWTGADSWTGRDAETDDSTCRVVVDLNVTAIRGADLVVLLAPQRASIGAWVELGYALRDVPAREQAGRPGLTIWMVGEQALKTIYRCHRGVHLVADDETALIMLRSRALAAG